MAGSRKRQGFTKVPNAVLGNPLLSPEAVGLLCWMMSHADSFQVGRNHMMKFWSLGRQRFDRIMGELKAAGYVRTETDRCEKGHFKSRYVLTTEVGLSDIRKPDHLRRTTKEGISERFQNIFPRQAECQEKLGLHLEAAVEIAGEEEVLLAAQRYANDVAKRSKRGPVSLPENWLKNEGYLEVVEETNCQP